MALKIYNSLTRQKEVFEPINAPYVGMYVCGPTVSGESHLGHARPFITFDVVFRYLLHKGYKVRYVRNITDAGHFEEEGKQAEDKITSKAILEKLEPMELVQKYTHLYHWAMEQFNNMPPSIEPTATGHIVEQIEMIKTIIKDGYAYEKNGSVYFDVVKYNEDYSKKNQPYGILSGRNLEEQLETTRELENQDEKKNKVDFALWKKAPAEHIMRWQSPWGEGFPGWHIECSAMATKYLGKRFDIHGGGMDLQFPHHECEIAQSTAAHNHSPAKYWIHHNMITINGQKMAKSLGNGIMVEELFSGENPLLAQAYGPMTLRFFVLQAHYRGTLDFSNDALLAAQKGWQRMQSAFKLVDSLQTVNSDATCNVDDIVLGVQESLNDDLNTPQVIAHLFELARRINVVNDGKDSITEATKLTIKSIIHDYCEGVLGMKAEDADDNSGLDDAMSILLELRGKAKTDKNWALSDQIRDALKEKGFEIKDGKDGTTWNKI